MSNEIYASTYAYTKMGFELVIAGILTIAMQYGAAGNRPAAIAVYDGTVTRSNQYPVWCGVFVSTLLIDHVDI